MARKNTESIHLNNAATEIPQFVSTPPACRMHMNVWVGDKTVQVLRLGTNNRKFVTCKRCIKKIKSEVKENK